MRQLIVKYKNRKLYMKDLGVYTSLESLAQYLKNNPEVEPQFIEQQTQQDVTKEQLVRMIQMKERQQMAESSTEDLLKRLQA